MFRGVKSCPFSGTQSNHGVEPNYTPGSTGDVITIFVDTKTVYPLSRAYRMDSKYGLDDNRCNDSIAGMGR